MSAQHEDKSRDAQKRPDPVPGPGAAATLSTFELQRSGLRPVQFSVGVDQAACQIIQTLSAGLKLIQVGLSGDPVQDSNDRGNGIRPIAILSMTRCTPATIVQTNPLLVAAVSDTIANGNEKVGWKRFMNPNEFFELKGFRAGDGAWIDVRFLNDPPEPLSPYDRRGIFVPSTGSVMLINILPDTMTKVLASFAVEDQRGELKIGRRMGKL